MTPFDLIVVMPVYNEAEVVLDVISSWQTVLSKLNLNYQILVLNDGSRDATASVLDSLKKDDRIKIIHKPNSGHGPTILYGYRKAAPLAKWVFQCDSDNEISPDFFPKLWEKRGHYDALFGVRINRRQKFMRKLISSSAKMAVGLLFCAKISDVNVPYRLMRADILGAIVNQIPDDTFAPNLIISGALSSAGVRLYELPVNYQGRKTGKVSLVKGKLAIAAAKSLWQTLRAKRYIKIKKQGQVNG